MRYGETSTPTGKTYASSLDVVGHEMTHGVTEHTAGLEYLGQSGALNESYSDLMGYIISGASNPEIGADTQSVDRKQVSEIYKRQVNTDNQKPWLNTTIEHGIKERLIMIKAVFIIIVELLIGLVTPLSRT